MQSVNKDIPLYRASTSYSKSECFLSAIHPECIAAVQNGLDKNRKGIIELGYIANCISSTFSRHSVRTTNLKLESISTHPHYAP